MTTAHIIATALAGRRAVRLADGSYLMPCPLARHGKRRGDRSPSLHVSDGATRLLVHCYAGCDRLDVLDELRRRGLLDDRPVTDRDQPPPRSQQQPDNIDFAARIWHEAVHIEGTPGALYFYKRGIDLTIVPDFGGLRWHNHCPWLGGPIGCVVARFTDAVTGGPRGIWRRPIKKGEKPRTLGPMGGCVIRLWPDEEVMTGLVIGEGVETVLAAAIGISHRNTLLQPAWAASTAGNLERFPVLAGIEALTILVDHDKSGTGQNAAHRLAERWAQAGREVTLLTPTCEGEDFNNVVMMG